MHDLGFSKRSVGEGKGKMKKPMKARIATLRRKIGIWLRRMQKRIRTPRQKQEWRMIAVKTIAALFGIGVMTLVILWFTLPDIDNPATMFPSQSTVILDRNGVELYRLFSEQDRTYVSGEQISPYAKKATIAIEDERFLRRSSCFDVVGFLRAALSQLAPGLFVRSGGSTLTQQFAKNALVGRKRSVLRKVRELMLACELESRYDKEGLLELYLNWIPFGSNAYGIEQAARNYFAIGAKDLSLPQAAVLAGLLQRPSYFSPYGSHRETDVSQKIKTRIAAGTVTSAADIPDSEVQIGLIGQAVGSGSMMVYIGGRTDQVLKNMMDQNMISLDEYNKALTELKTMTFAPDRQNIRAPHFVLDIQEQVEEMLGIDERVLEQGGFRITTTLDWTLQEAAEKAVKAHREDIRKRFGANNIALVALSPVTREILAYVGNADYSDEEHEGKIDMAASPRQPGSSFKVFTYLNAFEAGFGPGSVVYDIPTKFGEDQPSNFDGTFWGLTTMRLALGGSRNIPAIKAFFLGGGEESLLSLVTRMGITTPAEQKAITKKSNNDYDYGWPLSIGAAEVPLLEMVQGYATIADGGSFRPMTGLMKVTDKDGVVHFLAKQELPRQVVDSRLTAEVTSIISDISARPNDYWKQILSVPGFAAAAKTGTSNKCLERDTKKNCTLRRPESTWTMGFTPNLIAGVWVGNATSQSLFEKADGLTTAAPVWHDFMVEAHRKLKNTKTAFELPDHLTRPLLSRLSGKLASVCTPPSLQGADLFLEEQTPSEQDPACVKLKIDKVTGLLSSPACPQDAVEERMFFVPKSELPNRWPTWETDLQDWTTKQMELWNARPDHSGSLLPLPVAPTKECDPALTPGRGQKPSVSVSSPTAGATVSYPAFTPIISVTSASPIKTVQFFVDDKPLRSFDAPPYEGNVRVPRTIERSGSHAFKVVVTDQYFNTAEQSVMFVFE